MEKLAGELLKVTLVNILPTAPAIRYSTGQRYILGPKYSHKTHLCVKHAPICIYDMRMRYAQKANSLVFMS